jgi:kynurenine formamidase
MKRILLIMLACLAIGACQERSHGLQDGEWIDLTHEFGDDTIYWVTAEPFKHTTVSEGVTPGGFYYSAYNFSAAEHGGTHLDSPIHFAEARKTVEQLALTDLIGPAVKIDVSEKAAANRDYLITTDDIIAWQAKNGAIQPGTIILFQTGFAKFWPDEKQYLGTDQRGADAVKDLHFPGLHPDAAKWLAAEKKPKAVGIDTASIDFGQSTKFEAHIALMTNNIPAFENVGDMSKLPATGFQIIAMPMKIKGGSGAPLRLAAFVQGK